MRAYPTASWCILAATVLFPVLAGESCGGNVIVDTGGAGTTGTGSGGGGGTTVTSSGGSDSGVGCHVQADCAALDDACNTGSCVDNTCVPVPVNEGTSCPTGLFCTVNGVCKGGVCAGSPRTCPGSDACNVGFCDVGSQTCSTAPGNDGGPCLPANDPCFTAGFCESGTCVGTTQTDCSSLSDGCNTGLCNALMGCVKVPNPDGTSCPSPSACISDAVCMKGTCTGTPTTCPPSTTACQVNTCEIPQGCTLGDAPDGTSCSTMNPCLSAQTCTGGACGGGTPANEGLPCAGSNACTQGSICTMGACTGIPVTACISGDGCCPTGCTPATDSDCGGCAVNLARTAVPSASQGGSVAPYLVTELNNGIGESHCGEDSWIENQSTPSGAYWELDWPNAVTIASIFVEAPTADGTSGPCQEAFGRNVYSAEVQTWDGTTWVTQGAFTGQSGNFQWNLPAAVSSTKLRLFNVTAGPTCTGGCNYNSIIFEWHVFSAPGCIPPAD